MRKACAIAGNSYQLQPYSDRIVLFRASEKGLRGLEEGQNGWRKYAGGGLEIHEIDFHHFEILREPHVRALGEQLAACVEQASKRHAQSALCNEAASPSLSAPTRGGMG